MSEENKQGFLDFALINPFVRFVSFNINKPGQHIVPIRTLYDYSLIYVKKGEINFEYQGKSVTLSNGCLQLIPPGIECVEYIGNSKIVEYYVIHFDMFYDKTRESYDMYDMYLKYCTPKFKIQPIDTKYFHPENINLRNAPSSPIVRRFPKEEVIDKFVLINKLYLRLIQSNETHQSLTIKSLMLDLLSLVLNDVEQPEVNKYKMSIVNNLMSYINEFYYEQIDINDFAKSCGFTPNYLRKIFKEETSLTIHEYIRYQQLEKAKKFLIESDLFVSEISYKVGIKDPLYFTKIFRISEKCSPSEFRKKMSGK